ncbi:MAG TPA: FlgD immunoglobulin-like domain containing protein [Candidatus Eisenbacteria bacterium]|nr:FlgD immunoglobulin-like domain containing protein [Candidatus Eisenbacteria bacterium]
MRHTRRGAWLVLGLLLLTQTIFASTAAAGPFTRLQVLMPGESAAPGTASGKTGTPRAQVSGIPFTVTVRACDDTWATVTSVTHAVKILSSDASATLPAIASLSSGTGSYQVTFNAAGNFQVFAHDEADGTIPDAASATVASQVLASFVFPTISQKHQYAGVPLATTITAKNPNGVTVTGFNGTVDLREVTSFGEGRTSPTSVTFTNGVWSGNITMYRADETNINRGNVNLIAQLPANPSVNGSSDPFLVHPGTVNRLQIIVPGQTPLPGSVSGYTGSPATQGAGTGFTVTVYATDTWWNVGPSSATVSFSSSDGAATNAPSGALVNGVRQVTETLNTVGTQTVTASASGLTSSTSPPISVIPSSAHHFSINTITGPLTAGVPVVVTVRAVDASNNTVPNYAGDATLSANTGLGSISPTQITFAAGVWTGPVTFFGAGGAVSLTCSDFSAPPKLGTSNSFTVNPGPFYGLQVLVPGESAQGGTGDGKTGTPTGQTAGTPFTITIRAVDQYWNLVSGVNDTVDLSSTDAFATMPATTTLSNGLRLQQVTLFKVGAQTITASDATNGSIQDDTSSPIPVTGGAFSKVLILAPGESPAPGTVSGRTGTATDQSINYSFTVTALATDAWWNPVTGVTDVVQITSNDPLATLPPNTAMVDGRADMSVRLATGGFQQISVNDVTNPSKTGSTTQVRAISSGFHLEASVTPATARAGEPFTLTVKVTNDAGSVIQEINSFVTVEVQNASSQAAGRGALLTTQFQLLQGQRSVSQTYTFAEPIVMVVRDDAGNAPGVTGVIDITPGQPAAIRLTSNPPWVGGNKHALITARVVDAFENGVPAQPVFFSQLSGTGTTSPMDTLSDASGNARADFLAPRQPEHNVIRATSGPLQQDLDLEVAFVDPTAAGGYVTNYPNPFHPPTEATTIAYKLDDLATVTIRIYTQSGDLVKRMVLDRGTPGGSAGLNEVLWDGKNGKGIVVASGGYVALIEAQGTGETMHVIRRKIAVVR